MARANELRASRFSRSAPFSAKTEYACTALMELAFQHGSPGPVPLKLVAEKHAVPLRFLVQIMLQLKAAGIAVSVRGAAGGYRLGRRPEEITLADIVSVIDPQDVVPDEKEVGTRFSRAVFSVWKQIHQTELLILRQTTLADLLRLAEREIGDTYEI